jgi:GT2 family glycosyltransferase
MFQRIDVSVVISTYNGAAVLPRALDAILDQDEGDVQYEVIVVDNNSVDDTRRVIESYIPRATPRLRYVFESRQGLSYGRNAGIAAARGSIIAFSDDDIHVSRSWIKSIKTILDDHPEVDFIGGKVLPQWNDQPPVWLTNAHWSPLALLDYGPTRAYVNTDHQVCLVGANLAVRRAMFETVGLFSPDTQRVKDSIGSMEDHELLIRSWRTGRQGLYAPELIVRTVVQPDRLTKKYHRRWHRGHGVFCARLRYLEEAQNGRHGDEGDVHDAVTLFGVPGFLYRQIGEHACKWVIAFVKRREDLAFTHETTLRFLVSYVQTRYREEKARAHRPMVMEFGQFVTGLVRKKVAAAFLARQRHSP